MALVATPCVATREEDTVVAAGWTVAEAEAAGAGCPAGPTEAAGWAAAGPTKPPGGPHAGPTQGGLACVNFLAWLPASTAAAAAAALVPAWICAADAARQSSNTHPATNLELRQALIDLPQHSTEPQRADLAPLCLRRGRVPADGICQILPEHFCTTPVSIAFTSSTKTSLSKDHSLAAEEAAR